MKDKVPQNVMALISKFSDVIGTYESDFFSVDTWTECNELNLESPIEMVFFAAFKAICRLNSLNHSTGISCEISPQRQIGKYRVDFVVAQIHWEKQTTLKQAVIECDGTAFHERTEVERRYEKQRDRWLQSQDWKIFHFTGKEINDDPAKVAAEVISFLTGLKPENLLETYSLYGGD